MSARATGAGGRRNTKRLAAVAAGAFLFVGFIALGVWQLERLAWKQALIARVEGRVHAPPTAPPGPGQWASVTAQCFQ